MPLLKHRRTGGTIEAAAANSRNIQVDEASEENAYAARVESAHGMDPRARVVFTLCIALVVLYFLGLLVPKDMLNQGLHNSGYNAGYSFSWFVDDLMGNMNGLIAVFTGNDMPSVNFTGTMLRFVVVAIAGAGLALCGAVYQGSFKNALVSPSTLGVTSGATLGMMAWVVFCVPDDGESIAWLSGTSAAEAGQQGAYLIDSYLLAVMSFIGCLLVVGIVLLVMRLANNGKMSGIMMIITGQVVGGVAGAVSNMVRYYYVAVNPYGTKAQLLTDLTISSFYRNFTLVDVVAVLVPILVTFLVIMRLRNQMTLLQFSEAEARTMGVETRRVQVVTVALCTLLTAIIISFCGRVGFVGFLVPHLARRLVGPSFKYLLPAAAVLGAVFVLGAYLLVSCTLGPDFETMVGMFISIAGASVFLVTALRGKGGSRGQFQ
ncbi:MAG: FecCD family ABC transporter permease [Coriobacteriales bacterium]